VHHYTIQINHELDATMSYIITSICLLHVTAMTNYLQGEHSSTHIDYYIITSICLLHVTAMTNYPQGEHSSTHID
jgi:hypothetical protein